MQTYVIQSKMEVACDVLSVQELLGRTDVRITMIYTQVPNRVVARGEKTGRCLVRNKAAMRVLCKNDIRRWIGAKCASNHWEEKGCTKI